MRLTKEQRRAQILEVATRLFVEKGYYETKTKDIARECGVSEPVIYKHFNCKDDLFLEVIASIAGETFNEISFDRQHDTEYILSSYVLNKVEKVDKIYSLFQRLLTDILEYKEIRRYYFDKYLPRLAYPLIEYVDQLKGQGYIKEDIPSKVIALGLAGLLIVVSLAKNLEESTAFRDMNRRELAGQLLKIYFHGILK